MFNFGKKKKKESTPRELTKRIKDLEDQLEQTSKDLASFRQEMNQAFSKIGVVRFNPFGEIGGDQSFAIALLNQENTGVILTSYYGKDMNRVFGKPVHNGKPQYSLSAEEENALQQAMQESHAKTQNKTK